MTRSRRAAVLALLAGALVAVPLAGMADMHSHRSSVFSGAKVNAGTVTHESQNGASVLTLSADFVPPGTPDPHWQVVDSSGRTYLLQRLDIKGDKLNRSITVPDYVPDVVKVQMWCAFAETLLGEASFAAPVK